jgi:hypothetical protein
VIDDNGPPAKKSGRVSDNNGPLTRKSGRVIDDNGPLAKKRGRSGTSVQDRTSLTVCLASPTGLRIG